jgi:transposase
VISGIIFVIRNGLRWRDVPADYGPPKTIYNRFIRWSRMGVFNRIFAALAAKGGTPDQLMIDATPPEGAPDGRETFKTYGPPRPQEFFAWQLTGLHQRIRHSGRAVAKMESRTPQAS